MDLLCIYQLAFFHLFRLSLAAADKNWERHGSGETKEMPSKAEITSLSGFFGELEKAKLDNGRAILYRGHAQTSYVLEAALFRTQGERKD